jgi:ABC-type sugar transport system permease subunit
MASTRKRLGIRMRREIEGYLFMAPWIIGFLVFMAYPLLFSLVISFYKVNFLGSEIRMDFVGLKNFQHAFLSDEKFPTYFFLYIKQTGLIIFIIVLFALIISVLISQKFPGRAVFRAIFFLPVILSSNSNLDRLESSKIGTLKILEK